GRSTVRADAQFTCWRGAGVPPRCLLVRYAVERTGMAGPMALSGIVIDITEVIDAVPRESDLLHRLDVAAAAAGVGIWSVHRGTGEVRWNAQAAHIYGVPVDPP